MVEIITARLRLRQFTLDDVDAYYAAIHSDPDVMRYMPGNAPRPRDRTMVLISRVIEAWLLRPYGLWAVEMRDTNALIGHCGLMHDPDSDAVELGYALARSGWGQGLASEGARASLRYGFETLELGEIIALAEPDNFASRRVMEKAGMRFEGISSGYYGGATLALYTISRAGYAPPDEPYTLLDDGRATRPHWPA